MKSGASTIYATSNLTASAGVDYVGTNGTLVFAAVMGLTWLGTVPLTDPFVLAQVLATPDPTYGNRRPILDARVRAVLVSLDKGKKARKTPFADARLGTRLPEVEEHARGALEPIRALVGALGLVVNRETQVALRDVVQSVASGATDRRAVERTRLQYAM